MACHLVAELGLGQTEARLRKRPGHVVERRLNSHDWKTLGLEDEGDLEVGPFDEYYHLRG